jgi:hypothetical protein
VTCGCASGNLSLLPLKGYSGSRGGSDGTREDRLINDDSFSHSDIAVDTFLVLYRRLLETGVWAFRSAMPACRT